MTNYFYTAPPRQGKTFCAVAKGVEALKKQQFVLSNFPICYKNLSSHVWKSGYVYENIRNALIIIDEAQHDYDSQNHQRLSEGEDAFFAYSGHNSNDIIIISQNPTRVAKAVRDRINFWCKIRSRISIPFLRNAEGKLGRPLLCSITYWDDFELFMSAKGNQGSLYTDWVLFRPSVANSYDTHFFASLGHVFTPSLWIDLLKEKELRKMYLEIFNELPGVYY